jgi:transposase
MRKRWTPDEHAALMEMVGDYPLDILIKKYQMWANKHDYPSRSPFAIHQRLRRQRVSVIPIGHYLTSGTLAKLLGVSYTTIDRWVARGLLVPSLQQTSSDSEHPKRRVYIRRRIIELARSHPWLFGGTPRDNLFLLLESQRLVDSILEHYPTRFGRDRVKMLCVETGIRYESATAAARAVYVTKNCLTEAARNGTRAGGFHWKRL